MLIQIRHKLKAQSTLEYAFLTTVVIAGLIAVNTYMKRGYQGKMKAAADDLGHQYDIAQKSNHAVTTYRKTADRSIGNSDLQSDPSSVQSAYTHDYQQSSEEATKNFATDDWSGHINRGALR